MVWDPVSTSQTKCLTGLLHELVEDYPSLNSSSKNTVTLLKAVVHRINTSLDEDTFMPLYTPEYVYILLYTPECVYILLYTPKSVYILLYTPESVYIHSYTLEFKHHP